MIARRHFLALLAVAGLPLPAIAGGQGLRLGDPAPFSRQNLIERAKALAAAPFQERPQVPEAWRNLTYDQYRSIWFDTRNALWEGTGRPQRLDVFPPGLYFPRPVEIYQVENGTARPVVFDMAVFDKTDRFPDVPIDDTLGYSGLRLRAQLEPNGQYTEYVVFQGASYFRGIGAGEIYGLSARGLALKTADPAGEEFPDFVAFWVEAPPPGATDIVLHALLDSPSCAGAYTFTMRDGQVLRMDVEASLFPRTALDKLGIAPLTSMFLFDATDRDRFSDFRPAVHDSDGLLIHNGAGEVLWRPLANPVQLQVSVFEDENPHGFGLMQRARKFSDYDDLEALYHKRPSLWVTPGDDWGAGAIDLVEIPADKEIYDNIVAYWRPADPIKAGQQHDMSYRLHWGADVAPATPLLKVLSTAMGGRPEGGLVIVIEFAPGTDVPKQLDQVDRSITASNGKVSEDVLQRNPETGGPRLAFNFDPGDAQLSEFRVQLQVGGKPLSETWLYRWTKS